MEHHIQESKCSKDRSSKKYLKMTGRISDNDYDGKQDNREYSTKVSTTGIHYLLHGEDIPL